MAGDRHPRLTYKVQLPGGQSRLREMIVYISNRCKSAEYFGKVKLNKILWRADFTSFAERGVPVTGRAYQRLRQGPAPVEMPPVLAELFQDGVVHLVRRELGDNFVEERVIAERDAHLRFFSEDDIRYVDNAIEYYWGLSGTEASDDSHGLAWKSRENLDPMPYESALISDVPAAPPLLDVLRKFAEQQGLRSE